MTELPEIEPEGRVAGGPPCPNCRVRMEPGYLKIRTVGSYTLAQSFTWHEPGGREDEPGERIADLWASTHGGGPWLKGFRCRDCEIVRLRYGKTGLGSAGWQFVESQPPEP